MRTLTVVLAASMLLSTAIAQDEEALGFKVDRTGIRWKLPFKTAHVAAKESGRLLLIKPIAFGTGPDGRW